MTILLGDEMTIEQEIKSKIKELLPPPGYEKLYDVLQRAMRQAAYGKGKERHASGEPFHEQPICVIARWVGIGAQLGQAIKKSRESIRLLNIKGSEAAVFEILGAINWLAAAVIVIEERSKDTNFCTCTRYPGKLYEIDDEGKCVTCGGVMR